LICAVGAALGSTAVAVLVHPASSDSAANDRRMEERMTSLADDVRRLGVEIQVLVSTMSPEAGSSLAVQATRTRVDDFEAADIGSESKGIRIEAERIRSTLDDILVALRSTKDANIAWQLSDSMNTDSLERLAEHYLSHSSKPERVSEIWLMSPAQILAEYGRPTEHEEGVGHWIWKYEWTDATGSLTTLYISFSCGYAVELSVAE
jgi:hypothetical protein